MAATVPKDILVIGGGIAGLSAGMFTARHGLDTLVIDAGESILRRNAHIENFPGFPAGVNPRQLLDLLDEQAETAGCERVQGTVARVETADDGFRVELNDTDSFHTEYVIAATKNDAGYLTDLDGVGIIDRGKTYVDTDERDGRASTACTRRADSPRNPIKPSSVPATGPKSR